MKKLTLNKEQQQAFANRMNIELEKMTMSWDNDLRLWHEYAVQALEFASVASLNIEMQFWNRLFETDNHGVNMNVVMLLNNNLERVTPSQMGLSAKRFGDVVIDLNLKVAQRWQALHMPVYNSVCKEFEIMMNKPKMVMVPGQA